MQEFKNLKVQKELSRSQAGYDQIHSQDGFAEHP